MIYKSFVSKARPKLRSKITPLTVGKEGDKIAMMVTVLDTVIFCQTCGQPVRVPPGSRARRRYCPACELKREQEAGQYGKLGGRGHKKAPQPVPVTKG